ncbi:MAG: 50S ribosomal protein L31 [Crocosphaera sp.]|jgi:large subunit ribosomal protein L31
MAKPDIHPTWYPEAKVICNGEVVMMVGSTQPEINVEVWSGNHPFYTGTQKIIDTEGRVDRFQKRYAMIGKKGSKKTPKSDATEE